MNLQDQHHPNQTVWPDRVPRPNFAITKEEHREVVKAKEPWELGAIRIVCSPKFHIQFALVHMAYFTRMAETHYDARCKAAARVGGFIYGWKNHLNWASEEDQPLPYCTASTDELDTLLKICENNSILENYARAEVSLLVRMLLDAWRCAQANFHPLEVTIGKVGS